MTQLSELAELVGGTLIGDGAVEISSALPIVDCDESSITLIDSKKSKERFATSKARAAVVTQDWKLDRPQILVGELHSAFTKIVLHVRPPYQQIVTPSIADSARIDASTVVGAGCSIGEGVTIAANCRIGDNCQIHAGVHIQAHCCIGDGCQIFPGTVLYPQTRLGNRVILHAGAVIGADGFGYSQVEGRHVKSAQLGWVELQDDVEIGANSCVDRGVYGPTVVGEGTKLDNLVQIGHNCKIGKHNLLCAHVGVAGSSSTGDYVVLAGQVGMADHVHVGEFTRVAAQSGIAGDVPPKSLYFGTPAVPRNQKLREVLSTSKLPGTLKEIKAMQKRIEQLEARLHSNTSETNPKAA